jgi:small ligand-binding sensory domain FIST
MSDAGGKTKMQFAAGVSEEADLDAALDVTLGRIGQRLDDEIDLLLAFVSAEHVDGFPKIADRLAKQLKPGVALAVSAGSVLGCGRELEQEPGLSILAATLPNVQVVAFDQSSLDWPECEKQPGGLRQSLGSMEADPACILLFADPFSTPMVKLIPAMNAALPGVPIVGGMASAGHQPGDNRILLNDKLSREGLVGLALLGDLQADCTVSQGCRPIGEPWVITRAQHNILMELGGKNVMQVIRGLIDTLEPEDEALARQGLLIGRVIDEYKDHFGRGDFLIRSIMGADEQTGYIAVGDLLHVGQTVQFHVRDRKAAEEDLELLLENQKILGDAAGALLCTCNGRGVGLFGTPHVESKMILNALGDVPLAGFYAAGEIGPVGPQAFLHGFTASLAVFREKDQRS